MKTLQILTASAGILLALASPTLAASRLHSGAADAYASGVTSDRSGSYYYGPQNAQGSVANVPTESRAQSGTSRGFGEPYADRPYGDPDNW
jgi:hypothetical protein